MNNIFKIEQKSKKKEIGRLRTMNEQNEKSPTLQSRTALTNPNTLLTGTDVI